jgi:NADH-quinone oxidoreductase subunit E
MSVRRLAEDTFQPEGFAFTAENARWAEATIRKYPEGRQASAIIPLLMRAQEQDGWVTKAAIEMIADMLGMPYIRALEVATFYTQFQLKPVGTRAHVQVCGTTPCMLRGAEDLIAVCKKKIAARPFDRNEAGTLSWEEVECQGACVNAPMVMIFKDAYEDLTPERLEEIIDAFEAGEGAGVPVGPQTGRHLSAPAGGLTTLTDQSELEAKAREGRTRQPDRASAPANGAAGVAPTKKGRPKDTTSPTEADPSIVNPATAKGPGSAPAKSPNEPGGEPTPPGTVKKDKAKPAASGRSSSKAAASTKGAKPKTLAKGGEGEYTRGSGKKPR